jgi:transposase
MKDDVRMQDLDTTAAESASVPTPPSKSTEVPKRAGRRRFQAAYKLQVLSEVARCERGKVGAILRREGLYWSHIENWRSQQKKALTAKSKGRKTDPDKAFKDELIALQLKNSRLEKRLKQAECIIELQKKISNILGLQPIEESF